MNYYILNSNNEIALFDTDKSRLQTTLKFKPDLADAKIHQTTKEIVLLDAKYVFADEHQEEIDAQKAQKESKEKELALQKAIAKLGKEMTKADLMGDDTWKAELREEYTKLMKEAEK